MGGVSLRRPRGTPNLGYYLFSNVRIENRSVAYYHPADQPPPEDAPSECAIPFASLRLPLQMGSLLQAVWQATLGC